MDGPTRTEATQKTRGTEQIDAAVRFEDDGDSGTETAGPAASEPYEGTGAAAGDDDRARDDSGGGAGSSAGGAADEGVDARTLMEEAFGRRDAREGGRAAVEAAAEPSAGSDATAHAGSADDVEAQAEAVDRPRAEDEPAAGVESSGEARPPLPPEPARTTSLRGTRPQALPGAHLEAQTHAADRQLGTRVIAFVIALCVAVAAWAYSRPGHGSATGSTSMPSGAKGGDGGPGTSSGSGTGPAAPSDPLPQELFQDVSASYTIPKPAEAVIAWPSVGQSAVEVEGVGWVGSTGATSKPVPIASVTKTMTAYLILSDHPLTGDASGPAITVEAGEAALYSKEAAEGQSLVKVAAGERISERDALEALMLASADNVAKILARWDAGSIDAFVTSMNAAAKRLGMTHTRYTDPSGLDSGTVSTAPDQIKVAEAAMRLSTFRDIVAERTANVPVQGTIKNFNGLLGSHGVIGIKTGSTDDAGGCLLFAAQTTVGGHRETIIGVVLGQALGTGATFLNNTLNVASKLISGAAASLTAVTLVKPGTQVATVRRPGAATERRLGVAAPVTVVGLPGQTYRVIVSGTPSAPTLAVTGNASAATSSSAASRAVSVPLVPLDGRSATASE